MDLHHVLEAGGILVSGLLFYSYTYGRFPAHSNAFHLPGVWLQFSHLELEFYDKYFEADLYHRQAKHHEMWGD